MRRRNAQELKQKGNLDRLNGDQFTSPDTFRIIDFYETVVGNVGTAGIEP